MFQAAGHLKLMGRKLTQPMAAPPEVNAFPFLYSKAEFVQFGLTGKLLSHGGGHVPDALLF